MKQHTTNVKDIEVNSPYMLWTKALYAAFQHFNKELAGGEIKEPIITIQSRGRKAAYGWFGPERWKAAGATQHEINISAEYMSRPFSEVFETLIHEMAHAWNRQRDIMDCNALQWHNKHFKRTAEELGLVVSKMKGKGYAQTELGEKAKAAITTLPINLKSIKPIARVEKAGVGTVSKYTFITARQDTKAMFQALKTSCAGESSGVDFLHEVMEFYAEHNGVEMAVAAQEA